MYRIQRLLGRRSSRFGTAAPAVLFLVAASAAALYAFQPLPRPRPQIALMPQAATPALQPAPVQQNPYERWINEEVFWIASDDERAAFQRLGTDEERQHFIQQFWLRRDPTPDTDENELKEELYRRIAWANDQFAEKDTPGWKTDRGETYIRYGAPQSRNGIAVGTVACQLWSYGGGVGSFNFCIAEDGAYYRTAPQ